MRALLNGGRELGQSLQTWCGIVDRGEELEIPLVGGGQ
jgi:hypothetical protein